MSNILELIGRIRMDSAQAEGAIGRVTRGTDGLNISSRKAESAVKNFASVIRSGQEPVAALADSVANLSRAFGLGVGATVAIVGVVEVLKSFVYESEKLNTITDKLNSTMSQLRANAGNLDFAGSINQVKALTAALKESQDQSAGAGGGVLGRAGKTIAGLMGLSDYNLNVAQDLARNQIASAKAGAGIALDKRIEAIEAEKISKFALKNLEISRKYNEERRAAEQAGLSARDLEKIDLLEINELRKVATEEIEERGKKIEQQLEEEKRQTEKINEMRLRHEEQIAEARKKQADQQKKYFEEGMKGAGTILDKIREAAERLGRKDLVKLIDERRKEEQKKTDEQLLKMLGRPQSLSDPRSEESLQRMRIGQFAFMEADVKRSETANLFNQVDTVRVEVVRIAEILEERLGVPILKSAY